jgi:hypothetical protein
MLANYTFIFNKKITGILWFIFLLAKGFSIRIRLFGYMELDLPTPVSHPSSWGMHPRSCAA